MKKRLNILISSTQQWNPGDEFIRFGVQDLLKNALKDSEINWILWNRNPDLFVNNWSDARMKSNFLTNSAREPSLDIIDLVVLAGTPEWFGQPVGRIFAELLKYPDIPLLLVGIGSGEPNVTLEDYEIDILRRENTLIVTRSLDLSDHLNKILQKEKAIPLPCPALFCKSAENIDQKHELNKVGMILQSSAVDNQSIAEKTVNDTLKLAETLQKAGTNTDIICFYIDEFMRFSRLNLDNPIIYCCDSKDYLDILDDYSLVLSTRLHGAIASLSCLTPSILIADQKDYRLSSAQKIFQDILPLSQPDDLMIDSLIAYKNSKLDTQQAIDSFKRKTYQTYQDLWVPFFSKNLGI